MLITNQTEWTIFLPISSYVLSTIIFGITLYFAIELYCKIKKMFKFKAQEVIFYQNSKLIKFQIWTFILTWSLYLILTIIFILYCLNFNQNNNLIAGLYIADECLTLIFIIWLIVYLLFLLKIAPAACFALKNDKLVCINAIIKINLIINISNDPKRRFIYINWKDEVTQGNVEQLKLKYYYQLKDFLDTLDVTKKWR